jgi:hypothetical protein
MAQTGSGQADERAPFQSIDNLPAGYVLSQGRQQRIRTQDGVTVVDEVSEGSRLTALAKSEALVMRINRAFEMAT